MLEMAEKLIQLLITGGGWAVSVFLGIFLAKVYKDKASDLKSASDLLEARHQEFVNLLTENAKLQQSQVNLMESVGSAIDHCKKAKGTDT